MIRMNNEVVEQKQVSLVVGMLFIWVILFGFSCIVLAMMMPDASLNHLLGGCFWTWKHRSCSRSLRSRKRGRA